MRAEHRISSETPPGKHLAGSGIPARRVAEGIVFPNGTSVTGLGEGTPNGICADGEAEGIVGRPLRGHRDEAATDSAPPSTVRWPAACRPAATGETPSLTPARGWQADVDAATRCAPAGHPPAQRPRPRHRRHLVLGVPGACDAAPAGLRRSTLTGPSVRLAGAPGPRRRAPAAGLPRRTGGGRGYFW
jgi:hypothetical protein